VNSYSLANSLQTHLFSVGSKKVYVYFCGHIKLISRKVYFLWLTERILVFQWKFNIIIGVLCEAYHFLKISYRWCNRKIVMIRRDLKSYEFIELSPSLVLMTAKCASFSDSCIFGGLQCLHLKSKTNESLLYTLCRKLNICFDPRPHLLKILLWPQVAWGCPKVQWHWTIKDWVPFQI
jgi:hypothetical protein